MEATDLDRACLDVLIVGAGIGGVDAAYHVQSQGLRYAILERRPRIGGTWDAFRFPGVRSDSDLYTMGFPFYPWRESYPIASGDKILDYLHETIRHFGIDKHIRCNTGVAELSWDSQAGHWTVTTDGEKPQTLTSKFVINATGYYNHTEGYKATIPGLDTNFKGIVASPQFWPEDLDYAGKRVAVIGSGATAITLLPAMSKKAAKVTMVQRTPSYIIGAPSQNGIDDACRRWLPQFVSDKVIRFRWNLVAWIFWVMARSYPDMMRTQLHKRIQTDLDRYGLKLEPHFKPPYKVWDQRPCTSPDCDFFEAVGSGRADMVTGAIKSIAGSTIVMENGQEVEADVIVPATGFKLQMFGGAKVYVDGQRINAADKYIWRGMLLEDVPNMAIMLSYYNNAWTTGVDRSAVLASKIFKSMVNGRKKQYSAVVARTPKGQQLDDLPMWSLHSGYLIRSGPVMPKASSSRPWHQRDNWLKDAWLGAFGTSLSGLEFVLPSLPDKTD